jgi:tRNA A-37 threonylcarbamoyl transferase component Bud32
VDALAPRSWIGALNKDPFYRSRNSVMVRHGPLLLKFHRPRRFPKDHLRRYLGNSLASREVHGYRLMQQLGLRTPRVVGTRTLWNPLGRFDSISACRFLADTVTVKTLLKEGCEADRRQVIDQLAADIQRMWNAWVLYRDLHLNNVVVDKTLDLYWVDPELRFFHRYRSMRDASDRLMGRHLRINHRLLGAYGVEQFCSLILPKRPRKVPESP